MGVLAPLDAVVRAEIVRHLNLMRGNQRQAAQSLNVSRWTLSRYMKRFDIKREEYGGARQSTVSDDRSVDRE